MANPDDPGPQHDDPTIPYVHGRHLLPLRRHRTRYVNSRHQHLFAAEDAVRARIHAVDQQLVDLSIERKQLLTEISHIHDELRPRFAASRGRRRRAVSHEEPLPPFEKGATQLSGRELRAICLAFLTRARSAMTLRQIHVLLHRAGYIVAHRHPVKALADALGHEADAGRLRRVARATYATTPRETPPDPDSDSDPASDPPFTDPPDTLPDW